MPQQYKPDGSSYAQNEIVPFTINNPFIEFAHDEATNEVVGVRLGFGEAMGMLSGSIKSLTGNINIDILDRGEGLKNASSDGSVFDQAIVALAPYLTSGDPIEAKAQLVYGEGSSIGELDPVRAEYAGIPNGEQIVIKGVDATTRGLLKLIRGTSSSKITLPGCDEWYQSCTFAGQGNVEIEVQGCDEALGVTLDVVGNTLQLAAPRVTGSWSAGAIRYTDDPAFHGKSHGSNGALLPSYGSLSATYDVTTSTGITAGGREGEGLRIDNETLIHGASLEYMDDGYALALRDITGEYRIQDLRLDVTKDWYNRPAVGLTLGKFDGDISVGAVEMGAGGKSLGAINLQFVIQDHRFNGSDYTNAFYLQGGGHRDAGPQGLRIAAEWSLKLADLSFTEDGNRVWVSGLQSWGRGDVTVNVTRNEVRNGTQFYDGLRVGFEDLKAGYRINGMRVGSEDASLQGGTELLLALGVYPAYEFEMDGHITLGAGGASGDGLTVNSDIAIRNGKAAVMAAPYDEGAGEIPQKGLWLTDVTYDGHVRDMTIDMSEQGLVMEAGETWSTMDVGNVRLGAAENGRSFGRLRLQNFEKGSSMVISPGGAGNVCWRVWNFACSLQCLRGNLGRAW